MGAFFIYTFRKELRIIPRHPPESIGSIYSIPIDQLHPHPDNPFGIRDDPSMLELIESVKKHGVLVPAIARPKPDGGYELVAGHRRQRASQLAGLDAMPVIVMNLDDKEPTDQLPHIPFHGLRHTSATLLIAAHQDVRTVSNRLGHAQASTTMNIFAHALKENDRTASNALENMLCKTGV